MSNLSIVITGAVKDLDEATHKLVHEATEAFVKALHKLENVEVVHAQVISPVKTSVPVPLIGPGGSAAVVGVTLATGTVHTDSASPTDGHGHKVPK